MNVSMTTLPEYLLFCQCDTPITVAGAKISRLLHTGTVIIYHGSSCQNNM